MAGRGPLAGINNSKELEAWLRKQSPAMSVAFAACVALRVLPIVWEVRGLGVKGDFFAGIVLPIFRATGVAWAAAKYPAHATKLEAFIAAAAADATLWLAVSIDATRVKEGAAASLIARSPLWQQGQPDQLRSLWQEMKAALHAAKQDWQVWTTWYDDRLAGRVRGEERELTYVRIEEALWDKGPAIVNAEIRRQIEQQEPPALSKTSPRRFLLDGVQKARSPSSRELRIGRCYPSKAASKITQIVSKLPAF